MYVNFKKIAISNKIFQDYIHNYLRVRKFFQGNPYNFNNYSKVLKNIKKRSYDRKSLHLILREENIKLGASKNTLANIDLLQNRDTYVVVGGQQVGIFGGPLYTFYKALTTIKLAEKLTSFLGKAVIPIFWLASDDHDFSETNHINIVDKANQISTVKYLPNRTPVGQPMYSIELQKEIAELIEQIDILTFDSEFKENILTVLKKCYAKGTTLSDAFAKWLLKAFGKYGLVLIDPSHPQFKRIGSAIFKKEVQAHNQTIKIINKVNDQLKNAGYHNQVKSPTQALNLFFLDKIRRLILKGNDGKFSLRGSNRKFSSIQLAKLIDKHPEYFSPNVLLRPIFQDYCLPTIAYVAGPGEIAYFAQIKDLYNSFGIPMPIIFPRRSITIVEKKISKILTKHKLSPIAFLTKSNTLTNALIKTKLNKSLVKILTRTKNSIEQNLREAEKSIINFDSNLGAVVNKSSSKIHFELEWLEEKVLQSYKKQNEILLAQIKKTQTHLYPHKHLQERYLSWVPYTIKYGWNFVDTISKNIKLVRKGHHFLDIHF